MSTCNQLDLGTLGYRLVMPKISPRRLLGVHSMLVELIIHVGIDMKYEFHNDNINSVDILRFLCSLAIVLKAKAKGCLRTWPSTTDHMHTKCRPRIFWGGCCVYSCFVDFKQAFDTVLWNKLWKLFNGWGVLFYTQQAMKATYTTICAWVQIKGDTHEEATSDIGVEQELPMSPALFGLHIWWTSDIFGQDRWGFAVFVQHNACPSPLRQWCCLSLQIRSKLGKTHRQGTWVWHFF